MREPLIDVSYRCVTAFHADSRLRAGAGFKAGKPFPGSEGESGPSIQASSNPQPAQRCNANLPVRAFQMRRDPWRVQRQDRGCGRRVPRRAVFRAVGIETDSSKHFPEKPKKNASRKKILLLVSKIGYSSPAESELYLKWLKKPDLSSYGPRTCKFPPRGSGMDSFGAAENTFS